MSFLSDVVGFFSGNSVASSLVKIAGIAYIAKKLSSNTTPENNIDVQGVTNIDQGVRLQIPPASNNKIPVLYGSAFFGGIITDAVMTNTNKTMYYCLTLSEKTGTLLSSGTTSTYVFKDIYWNDQRIVFKTDGITVNYTVDREGNIDRNLDGQVKFYCYAGNSRSPKIPENYTNTNTSYAYTIMPFWSSSTHMMNDLIFSICKVDYNREKNVTGLGTVLFHIDNSMKLPGDVLYDYMTNTRYGAGTTSTEILVS
jgi:hypothetical protein